MQIKSQVDFWGGLFIAFGLLAIIVARDYPMGSAMRMGPGYFPTYIGIALVAFGAWIAVDGFRKEGERIGSFPWRAIVLLSVGFSTFAWLILAFVLGPLMEENLRRALLISRGDFSVFLTRPISAGFLIATVVLTIIMILPTMRQRRDRALEEPV